MQVVGDKAFFFQDYALDLRRGCLRRAGLRRPATRPMMLGPGGIRGNAGSSR